jgi:magnesium chelatase subunit D
MSAASDAALVAALFGVDPAGLGGVWLRSLMHPARDEWLRMIRELLPAGTPLRRIPCNISDDRLLGGLDLAATLAAGRPIAEQGVLAAADGGVLVVAMAERLSAHTAGCLNQALDGGRVAVAREGLSVTHPARVGVVALDEGMSEDERIPGSLLDRLAFAIDLNELSPRAALVPWHDAHDILAARRLLPRVQMSDGLLEALCGTALALGAGSLRLSVLAARAAKASAALDGRADVIEEDAVLAGRLVLAPRATLAPPGAAADSPPPAPSSAPDSTADITPDVTPNAGPEPRSGRAPEPPQVPAQPERDAAAPFASEEKGAPADPTAQTRAQGELESRVIAAGQAAIPTRLLAQLRAASADRVPAGGGVGRSGALRSSGTRGRPNGVRGPGARGRLHVIETLRAAAPWQRLRGRGLGGDTRLRIQPADFRVLRYTQRASTLTIFAVDASGSSALNRLAEAKGAVELLLADCYIRRDRVAVIAFRVRSAELLLPPTRSLVRAKRSLAGLPGGGGTPLAAAIHSATLLAVQAQRRGETPTLVLLTDGRANITRDGSAGREAAYADALGAARALGHARITALFIDTSPKPNPLAQDLAAAMRAGYLALPYASAQSLSGIVKAATDRRTPGSAARRF